MEVAGRGYRRDPAECRSGGGQAVDLCWTSSCRSTTSRGRAATSACRDCTASHHDHSPATIGATLRNGALATPRLCLGAGPLVLDTTRLHLAERLVAALVNSVVYDAAKSG
jgi:hypothetical protein